MIIIRIIGTLPGIHRFCIVQKNLCITEYNEMMRFLFLVRRSKRNGLVHILLQIIASGSRSGCSGTIFTAFIRLNSWIHPCISVAKYCFVKPWVSALIRVLPRRKLFPVKVFSISQLKSIHQILGRYIAGFSLFITDRQIVCFKVKTFSISTLKD